MPFCSLRAAEIPGMAYLSLSVTEFAIKLSEKSVRREKSQYCPSLNILILLIHLYMYHAST